MSSNIFFVFSLILINSLLVETCSTPTSASPARLQSFPDNFIFEGNVTEVRRQIGNAVPPVGVREVAKRLRPLFTGDYKPIDLMPEYEKMKTMTIKQRLEYVTLSLLYEYSFPW